MSTTEWIASENIAELPVIPAAMNFVMAISRFPMKAATTTFIVDEANFYLALEMILRLFYGFSQEINDMSHWNWLSSVSFGIDLSAFF